MYNSMRYVTRVRIKNEYLITRALGFITFLGIALGLAYLSGGGF